MSLTKQARSIVHVAGPVEQEKVGNLRVERQRCLSCDLLMRDAREKLPFWLLGQKVAHQEDGWIHVVERAELGPDETRCHA